MSKSVRMRESLSEQKLVEFGSQLKSLPTAEEFKKRAENDLWDVFTGQQDAGDEINYEDLPESSKGLIGTVSSGDDEKEVPWWLEEFEWTATSTGEEEISLNKSTLSKFQNFVPEQTVIQKPELETRSDVYKALGNFETIREELETHLDFNDAKDGLGLPENIFTTQEGGVQTTNEFREWFNSLAQLCPPFNAQLTALLMLNTGVKEELARESLPDDMMEVVEEIGLVNNDEIYNEEYFESVASARYHSRYGGGGKLLTYDWSVFDLQLPYIGQDYNYLSPLEAALIENWLENNEIGEGDKKYLLNTGISSETEYARIALQAPVTKERGKSKFVTLRQIKDKSLSASSERKKSELERILEKHGIEDE